MPVSYLTNMLKNSTLFAQSGIEKCIFFYHNQNTHTELIIFHKMEITIDLFQPLFELLLLIQLIKHLQLNCQMTICIIFNISIINKTNIVKQY